MSYSLVATALTFVLGLLPARAMSRYRGKGKEVIGGVLTLPFVLPPTVIGFFLLLLFGRNSALGQLLQRIGLTSLRMVARKISSPWPVRASHFLRIAGTICVRTASSASPTAQKGAYLAPNVWFDTINCRKRRNMIPII